MSEKTYKAGLYLRLSKDDERAGESVSIENQRLLLTSYVQEKGWDITEIYIDDGWSGTTMQRPAFQRMMRDAEDKRINLIIAKDLSRIGRNYIEVGRLTEDTLPRLGCRFVALNDSVDSMLGENDMMVYRNLFNEFHSKDTSKKVRAVKRACMEQGKYLGTWSPLGYKKDPANKHKLLIDEETAHIVKRIFKMRCQGNSFRSIATTLNAEHIPSPKNIIYGREGRQNPARENGVWNNNTVKFILKNEAYIGNMIQGKSGTVSYKNQKLFGKPKESWVRVENTHDALVDMETWETVRLLESKNFKPRAMADSSQNMFVGLLKCADCGFNMRTAIDKSTLKDGTPVKYVAYRCSNYARSGKTACSIHTIYENVLAQLILEDIHAHAESLKYDEQRMIDNIMKTKNQENRSVLASHKQNLKLYEARMKKLEESMQTLHEDKVSGEVSDMMFKTVSVKYEAEYEAKKKAVDVLRANIKKCESDNFNLESWLKIIRKYAELDSLTQDILIELIDKIEVFEADRIGSQRVCRVQIFYRFVGNVGQPELEAEVTA